jgi:glutaminyl-tRNA synthetase
MIKTRFPPEPNGYIHLGHLKSICKSFEFAKNNSGYYILRFDDTNPSAEKTEYIESIIDDIKWLGYEKFEKITYTSDYFDLLYEYAIKLIKNNLAYADFNSSEEFSKLREEKKDSKYRNNTIEENLKIFDKMKSGFYAEGECCLKLKIDMQNDNTCMRDPTAYRIKLLPHHRAGDKWCIYPTYDFSHSIIDSTEGITHSFCTNEFYIRRGIYYWVLEKLELRNVEEIEYSKLDLEGIVLSKRKIIDGIKNNNYTGFNDPRLYTIKGLRERGFNSECLVEFCKSLTYNNTNATLEMKYFENHVRDFYNTRVERRFAVRNPIELRIVGNLGNTEIKRPVTDENQDELVINITNKIFIENDDFRETHDNKYRRLSPINKYVRLKYLGIIEYFGHDNDRIYVRLHSEEEAREKNIKPRATIHWISEDHIKTEMGYIDNEGNLKKVDILLEKNISNNEIVQLERIGYYNANKKFLIIDLLSSYSAK